MNINIKKCIGDGLSAVILLLTTQLPFWTLNSLKYISLNMESIYFAQYCFVTIIWLIFVLFLITRIVHFFEGKYIAK